MATRRGRPRSYDEDTALDAALEVFWSRGFKGTSLDALSEATGMRRPSLYAAFGNKEALFARTLERFQGRMQKATAAALAEPALEDVLRTLFHAAVDVYAPRDGVARGCLVFGVASVEAAEDEALRTIVAGAVQQLDRALRARIEAAISEGELPESADARTLAQLSTGVLHTLSTRARSGASRRSLRQLAAGSASLLVAGARAHALTV